MAGWSHIGQGFQLLAKGLASFVDQHMSSSNADAGSWLTRWEEQDQARFAIPRRLSKNDPAVLLRVLTQEWHVFRDVLPREARHYAGELRETRNRWAHHESFTPDQTRRALETMALLLTAAGSIDAGQAVRALQDETSSAVEFESVPDAVASISTAAPDDVEPEGESDWGDKPGERDVESDEASVVTDSDSLLPVGGIMAVVGGGGFIRTSGYWAGPNDVSVSGRQIGQFDLRPGDAVTGAVVSGRPPPGVVSPSGVFSPLVRLDTINGFPTVDARDRPSFDRLTAIFPDERLRLENDHDGLWARVIDIVVPLGKGQRILVVAPPRAGKVELLQAIAAAISRNNPECHMMAALFGERREVETNWIRSARAEVIATGSLTSADSKIVASELILGRAKRLVELNQDVVLFFDSLTGLARLHAATDSTRQSTGSTDPQWIEEVKSYLNSACNVEGGGSLTLIGTIATGTGSKTDDLIDRSFAASWDAKIVLSQELADAGRAVTIDIHSSRTVGDGHLIEADELSILQQIRRALISIDRRPALDFLVDRLSKATNNIEFLIRVARSPQADW